MLTDGYENIYNFMLIIFVCLNLSCNIYFIFYRENPDKLFEVFLEVGKPAAEDEGNTIYKLYSI